MRSNHRARVFWTHLSSDRGWFVQRRMSRTSGWWAKSSRWTAVCLCSRSGLGSVCFVRQWLVRVVVGARKDFLKFVTARVRLPSGGLKALSRKVTSSPLVLSAQASKPSSLIGAWGCVQIEIRRSTADATCVPHGHTCALALDLPAYGSQVSLLPT